MRLRFISTSRASPFMTELLEAVAAAISELGHETDLTLDAFPAHEPGNRYVVVPHEFETWGDRGGFPDAEQRASTIAFCTENPGTPWFEQTARLLPGYGAAVGINRSSVKELDRRGLRTAHVQLGYSPYWDTWHGAPARRREIDVLYLGAADPRRDPLLGSIGSELWDRRCQFLVPPLEPRMRPRPDFLLGKEKYERLRAAETLLNLHRTSSSALEWMRFLEAICNGCVVASEPCADPDPLCPGEHFLAADVADLPREIGGLLEDPDRLNQIRSAAYQFVTHHLRMADGLDGLLATAEGLPDGSARSGFEIAPPAARIEPAAPCDGESRRGRLDPNLPSHVKRLGRIATLRYGRRPPVVARTPTYAEGKPRVSVLCLARPERRSDPAVALDALSSSRFPSFETLLTVDFEQGDAAHAARRFIEQHPEIPAALLHVHERSRVARMRNALVRSARGEYLLFLDPEGGIHPTTIARLAEALDANHEAFFSYGMTAVYRGGQPAGLRGSLPWEPERLRMGGWTGGVALIRRDRLIKLGGYANDEDLAGSGDLDFFRKCAQADGPGAHVPQVLAWLACDEEADLQTIGRPEPDDVTWQHGTVAN
jgi:hypothetical protein